MTQLTRRHWLGTMASAAGITAPRTFEATWESLQQYRCPDWFRDAKLGIWAHWGPQCVPRQGDWYARNMYLEGSAQYRHHLANYGHPSRFGYKDLLPLWKAERFDPDGLLRRYKAAGAKYFVALGVHHDNYDCWNSKHHRWNSVRVGPGKDIVGLWREPARRHGLRFGVTEHLARSWSWFNVNKGADKTGPLAGVPYDGNDRRYKDLYFPLHDETTPRYPAHPPESYTRHWLARITDLLDSYQPDLLYTDGGVPFGQVGLSLAAHFYNQSQRWNGGRLEAVYNLKDFKESPLGKVGEYREGMSVLDLERGIVNDIRPEPWQTDTCIGQWFYKNGIRYKSAETVVHMLADIVSKNGNLLLNFPLQPDGTLDRESEEVLAGLTAWMAVHAEAIHGTRPWHVFGEGPRRDSGGQLNENRLKFGPEDIRYTVKGDVLYAICLGWPDGTLLLRSLAEGASTRFGRVERVTMPGVPGTLKWTRNATGLAVELPETRPSDYTAVVKISGA